MQNPSYDLNKLEQHLVSGGSAIICTDQISAWERTALVLAFETCVRLIPFEVGESALSVVSALDAFRAAGKMSVRVIIESAGKHAFAQGNHISEQIGLWIQQTAIPHGLTVEFVVQTRSLSVEEMLSLYNDTSVNISEDAIREHMTNAGAIVIANPSRPLTKEVIEIVRDGGAVIIADSTSAKELTKD
ncbi:MAG: hypothetical protein RL368_1430 [Pseudomonadota bacterium]|jgi:hypothetical protein